MERLSERPEATPTAILWPILPHNTIRRSHTWSKVRLAERFIVVCQQRYRYKQLHGPPWRNSFFGNHVLLEFAVGHFVDDDEQVLARVFYFIHPFRHPATRGNIALREALGSAQRTKAAGIVF